jgi:hypothetical protein
MSTHVECDQCGNQAVISYVKIPGNKHDGDGNVLTPDDWLNVIECPKCGIREQNGEKSRQQQSKASQPDSD